ncbi:hypothetical protein BT96DRAFT_999111 [Gymnopus androsaceus JB14]|uniref:GOLD domain-containing protein n=1 Tax=Gymnopus androsaceus JB14 TaxID=1447944 RepID=A0A6A4H7R7_9AGAR|nr:hypothetical protein BT96DRAFT_999111 [Gymnopus androsaceus JB14]
MSLDHFLSQLSPLPILFTVLTLFTGSTPAIKFSLQAYRYPIQKCIWNPIHNNALVIVTANVGPGEAQKVDIEIVDSSPQKTVYLSKKNINGETRLAAKEFGLLFTAILVFSASALLFSFNKLVVPTLSMVPSSSSSPPTMTPWQPDLVNSASADNTLTDPAITFIDVSPEAIGQTVPTDASSVGSALIEFDIFQQTTSAEAKSQRFN